MNTPIFEYSKKEASNKVLKGPQQWLINAAYGRTLAAAGIIIDCAFIKVINKKSTFIDRLCYN
jgi:hypothetical protein